VLIGISAAQRRGFNMAAGVIGGLLLGPLANAQNKNQIIRI